MTWTLTRLRASAPGLARVVEETTPALDVKAPLTADVLERVQSRLKPGSNEARVATRLLAQIAAGAEPSPQIATLVATEVLVPPAPVKIGKDWTQKAVPTLQARFSTESRAYTLRDDGSMAIVGKQGVETWNAGRLQRAYGAPATNGTIQHLRTLSTGDVVATTFDQVAICSPMIGRQRIKKMDQPVDGIDVTPHGTIVWAKYGKVERWDNDGNLQEATALPWPSERVRGLPDGGYIASGSMGVVRFEPGKGVNQIYRHNSVVIDAAPLSTGGHAVLSLFELVVVDADGKQVRAMPMRDRRQVHDLGNGLVLVVGGYLGDPTIWNTATGEEVQTLRLKNENFDYVRVLGDGRIAVVSGQNLYTWDVPV